MPQFHEDNERAKAFTRRALVIGGAQALLLSALGGRMYYLQVLEADRYRTLAEDNRINLRLVPPPRGRIVDRFGEPLAVNQQNYRVVIVREQTPDVRSTLLALSQIVELDEYEVKRILRDLGRKHRFVPVTVRDNLTWEQVSRIEVNTPELPGVAIEEGQTRHYPYGAAMSQVLGYVAAVSERELTGDPLLELPGFRIGKTGIERAYDQELRGTAGTSQLEVNAYGRVIRELNREEAQIGRELVSTIDAGLQTFVHQRLQSELSAAAVVLDIKGGDVMALCSVPSYDPNLFNLGISVKDWQALINDPLTPLSNKAIAGLFAPGSTYKPVVALAALEAGIGADHTVYCPGYMTLGNARFHCWKRGGHGRLAMVDGIKHSCDVYFYDVARRLGVDRMSAMANRLGLGEPVGIDLPGEKGGLIPTAEWKLGALGERWQGGETLVAAIGQGFTLTTPLQLAVMTARIASGMAVEPRIVRGFLDQEPTAPRAFPSLDIPAQHLGLVRAAMDAVVNDLRGTAHRARIAEPGWEMAGKTGTSQVRRITASERLTGVIKNEDLPWRRRDHALFVAFAPVSKPRYACSVVVQHGGGGSAVAAPIARDILIETQRRDPVAAPALPLMASAETAGS
ncbi:MAG: penicillin-binding protein 2 [Kiloniellales bacterium]